MSFSARGGWKLVAAFLRKSLLVLGAFAAVPALAANTYYSWSGTLGDTTNTGHWAELTTDISVPLTSTAYRPSNCTGPAYVAYNYSGSGNTTAGGVFVSPDEYNRHVADPYGIARYLPITFTNCTTPYGQPAGDGSWNSGHGGWGVVTCLPGYSVGRYYASSPLSCQPDATNVAPTDTANQQGTPADCEPCREEFLSQVAGRAKSNRQTVGDPVNAANGNELFTETDYVPAGSSLVAFSRYYNSGVGADVGLFGPGWSHSFRYRALVGDKTGSSVALVRPDGSSMLFAFDPATSKYVGPANDQGRLTQVQSGGQLLSLTYTRADGTQEQYTGYNSSCYGCLTKIVLGQGGQLTATSSGNLLTGVADNRGHTVQLAYGDTGGGSRITKVTLPGGAYITYAYSSQGVLTSATYPDGTTRSYEYAGTVSRPLLTKVYAGGNTAFATITYDAQGRATSTKHGTNAELTTLVYSGGSTTVTNSLGYQKTMAFSSAANGARAQTQSIFAGCNGGCTNTQDSYGYDGNGNLAYVVDATGVMTCLSFDVARNLPLKAVEGLLPSSDCSAALASPPSNARTRTWQWHATYALPMQETGPQNKVLYNYDSLGRMLTQTEVETNDLSGALGASAPAVGTARTTTRTYNAQGSVLSVKEPRSDVNVTTTFGYDGNENLVSITTPLGLVTTLGNYDSHGRPGLITSPKGLQTSVSYDARGRTTQVVTAGSTTTYGYDAAGLLVSSTLPSGVALTFGYDDAHRLVLTQDSLGNRVERVLDTEGNALQETVKGNGGGVALARQAAYDQLSRVTAVSKAH